MKHELNYKDILKNLSACVLLAERVYTNGADIDFKIVFINDLFYKFTKGILKEGSLYSEFKHLVSNQIGWEKYAQIIFENKNDTVEEVLFSYTYNSWIKISIKKIDTNLISLVMNDISKEKSNEQLLDLQKRKLVSLKNEISTNEENLNQQKKSIKTLHSQLIFAAFHDSLTNLYNKAWIVAELKKYANSNSVKSFHVLLVEIDNINVLNDLKGHRAGDELIRNVASVFKRFETENIIPVRFSGDEFLLLFKNVEDKDTVKQVSSELLKEISKLGAAYSSGIAVYPEDSENSDDILKFADMAKSEAKKQGKNNTLYFKKFMQKNFLEKINIQTKLSKAMLNKVFSLYFQPQYKIDTNELRGFEALIRWYDNDLGWISPEQFIPLAEETQLVIPLGEWVLETAISTLAIWEKTCGFEGIMSVNVSPVQFKKANFVESLISKVKKYGITPGKLEVEITEGIFIDDKDDAISKLNEIKSYGIGISLDDFGVGYSSLSYLQKLPLDTLKIDKSFIQNVTENNGVESNIIESIVNMVSKMGLSTIAEGVETYEQLSILKKFNCSIVQGFLKGKPMPKTLCEKMLMGDEASILTINDYTPENA